MQPGPQYSMASRFNSDIRLKEHLHPKKSDGPGPGDYQMQSSIKNLPRHTKSQQISTFGKGKRDRSEDQWNQIAPTHY